MPKPLAIAGKQKNLKPGIHGAAWLQSEGVQAVFRAIGRDGHVIRAVGGAVRNTLLGLPVADIDFATDAIPLETQALAEAAGLKTIPTGVEHGTITIIAHGQTFEVTTLREDVETDGRRAIVRFGRDWTRDAERRDFTMNALYADASGAIFDPLGGLGDVLARRVRFIGNSRQRIREDYLRTLRFFRFHAQYGRGAMDARGLSGAVREREGLRMLSPERVRVELFKLLTATGVKRALAAMFEHGLLVQILGGPPRMERLQRMAKLEAVSGRAPDAIRRLAALATFASEDVGRLAARFRLSNEEKKRLEVCAAILPAVVNERTARRLLYKLGAGAYTDFTLMAHAESGVSAHSRKWAAVHDLPQRWTPPELPLKGGDLIALGALKGPRIGGLLADLEEKWIAADFAIGRDALLRDAKAQLGAL